MPSRAARRERLPQTETHTTGSPPFSAARAVLRNDEEAGGALLGSVAFDPVNAASPDAIEAPSSTIHCKGDMLVSEGAEVGGSISTDAALTIGPRARLRSDVRADAGAEVGDGATIDGALQVRGTLAWGAGAQAASVRVRGGFVTRDGLVRATDLHASQGVRPGHESIPGGDGA